MEHLFRQQWNSFRPVLTGWLVLLLLLPAVFSLAPKAAGALNEEQVSALCSKAAGDKSGHSHHQHDCPCCLAGQTQLAAALPAEQAGPAAWLPVLQPVTFKSSASQVIALHAAQPPPARGPPSILSV